MLQENNVRRGFLQDEHYLRLSRECAIEGVWLAGLFETAYAYGWREDELVELRVGQLDLLGKIIDLGETKNGDQRMILMTEHVFQILVRCVAGKKPADCVFTRDDGSPVKDFRQAWWNARIRSGLGRFQCRDCESNVSEGRKCTTCNSNKKAKYIGGNLATYGLLESDDIHKWVDWLEENEHPDASTVDKTSWIWKSSKPRRPKSKSTNARSSKPRTTIEQP